MAPTDGFDAFVGARQQRAQRAAYLLTRDWQLAEDLLQTSLTKLWLAWSRVDDRTPTHSGRWPSCASTRNWPNGPEPNRLRPSRPTGSA